MDLELVPTEDLVDELIKRSECGSVILLRKMTPEEQDVDRYWWGNPYTAMGLLQNLCHLITVRIATDEFNNSEAESEDEI